MSFSAIDGYAVVAELRCGSNGSASGAPELMAGGSTASETTTRRLWDSNPADGFDSGWVRVELTVTAGSGNSGVVFSIGTSQVEYAGTHVDEILGFTLRAGVSASGGTFSFRNISAQFFRNATDSVRTQTGEVDDIDATTVGKADEEVEATTDIYAEGSGYHKARVFAEVRMESGALPNPNDLFGQIFVFATSSPT